jgi:hypothetical protein
VTDKVPRHDREAGHKKQSTLQKGEEKEGSSSHTGHSSPGQLSCCDLMLFQLVILSPNQLMADLRCQQT